LTHILETGDGTAHKLSDFITRRQLRNTGLYDEVYRVAGVESGLCVALAISKTARPVVIGIGLHRGKADFSERDRLVLNLLRPHLVQAYQNAVAVSQLGRALDEQSRGIIALDRQRRIRLITKRAQAWLAEYGGWTLGEGGRLAGRLDEWLSTHLQSSGSSETVPTLREPLVLRDGSKRLIIRLLEVGKEPLLHLEEQHASIPAETLQTLHLTPREGDVLAWMAMGKTNGEIAQIVGMRPRTVEKHCENIYLKLGVESRAAAARRALEAVPQLVHF
jgi:DNA-binding CsgD family transcriptional regulator